MTNFTASVLTALFLSLLAGCGGTGGGGSDALVVYTAGPRSLAQAVCDAYTASTGTDLELFQATTGQVLARLEAEKHRPRADVVIFASEVAAEGLKQQGRLQPYRPKAAEFLLPDTSDAEHMYHMTGAALVGVAVRTDAPPLPDTWRELLTEDHGAALIMPSPSRSGSAGDFTVTFLLENGEEATSWFQTARSQGLEFAAANSQAIGSLLMGAHDAIPAAADYLIYPQIAKGEPLRMLYPREGAVLVPRPIAITSSARNPEAARAFVDFYFSETAQALVADHFLLPARTDTPSHPVRPDTLPKLLRADITAAVERHQEILLDFQIRVERFDPGSTP